MKTIFTSAVTAALVVVCLLAFNAYAGRSAGGTYTLASPGVPFQSGQVISSTQMNNTFNDIATTLTNSLDRSGNGGMLAALRGIDGTQAAPAFSWTSETNSGLFRNAAGDVRMSILNTNMSQWNTTGLGIGIAATVPFQVQKGASNTTVGLFQSSVATDATVGFLSLANGSGVDLNSKNGAYATASTAGAFAIHNDLADGSTGFYTAPAGVAAAGIGFTERVRIAPTGMKISAPGIATGIPNNGSGFKHSRQTGCLTAASLQAQCTSTVTWGTTFADANYTAVCFAGTITGSPLLTQSGKAAATLSVVTTATTAVGSQATIDCIAVHD